MSNLVHVSNPLQSHQGQLMTFEQKIKYCEVLANADMLPESYRKKPSNVLIALEYGASLGLPVVVAMMEIYVVGGRPCMSARLMNALCRRAGHSISIDSQPTHATCIIIRKDSPNNATRVTFSMDQARTAGLANKDIWKAYGPTMCCNRAISACCRLAIPDLLMGLAYTPEELGDDGKVEMIQGEIVQHTEQPADEPGTSKSYSRIRVSEAQPVPEPESAPKRTRKKEAAPEPEQAPQVVDESPANDWDDNLPSKDNSPASEAAISDAWEAWKSYYAFDRQTGEKKAGLAKEMLEKIFPGLSMRNATVAQIDAVQGHLAEQAASF